MSFFNYNENSAKSADGFEKLGTGIYDAVIETASTKVAGTGTTGVDFAFEINGNKVMVYGLWIARANGETLSGGNKLNALMGLLGVKDLTEVDKTITKHDGSTMKVSALKELDGKKVKVALQNEKSWYNGKETNNLKVHTFFNDDGLTFSEVMSGAKEGKKLEYLTSNLKDQITQDYKAATADGPADEPAEEQSSGGSLLG